MNKPSSPPATRDTFSSSFGVLAATLGSAVGLGNIWKFPYLTGANGGAGFLLIYVLSTLLVALPVMISEIMLGRKAKTDTLGAFHKLAPGTPWWILGGLGVVTAFVIMAFYSEVAAWVLAYVFNSISGNALTAEFSNASGLFDQLTRNPWQSLLWQMVVLLFIGGILLLGVSKGIEAVTKKLMPLLFFLLLLVGVRSLLLPGAYEGLRFLFQPDFSKISSSAVLTALGLAFFKLSIGMGTMLTYGSYFREQQNIPATALRVMTADLVVSMLAGIAIFPAVFAFGFEPQAGPSLLFITIPVVFAHMPLGQFFLVAFFVLTFISATGAMLSILEVPVSVLSERFGWTRTRSTVCTLLALMIAGAPAALSNSVLSDFTLLGLTVFELFDKLTSNLLMPLNGILLSLFIGWFWGPARFLHELSNSSTLDNRRLVQVLFLITRWVSPLLILLVMLGGLGIL